MWIFFSAYSWYFAFVSEFALVFWHCQWVFVLDMFSMLLVLFVIIAYLVLLYLLLPLPLLILQLSMGRCVCSPRRQTSTLTTPYMLTCNSLGKPLPANSDIFILLFPNRGCPPALLWKLSGILFSKFPNYTPKIPPKNALRKMPDNFLGRKWPPFGKIKKNIQIRG